MDKQEIYKRLLAFKQRQLFDGPQDEEYVSAILWDIAMALGLSGELAALLAGDEVPDDLITITAASQRAGVTTNAISGRISRGDLAAYVDEDEPNPTRARRVSQAAVDAIKWRVRQSDQAMA